jgi:hypothetical protein
MPNTLDFLTFLIKETCIEAEEWQHVIYSRKLY